MMALRAKSLPSRYRPISCAAYGACSHGQRTDACLIQPLRPCKPRIAVTDSRHRPAYLSSATKRRPTEVAAVFHWQRWCHRQAQPQSITFVWRAIAVRPRRCSSRAFAWPLSIKETTMQVPSFLQGESLKRLMQGAALGAVATIVVGFNWGGWTLGSTAKDMAQKSSVSAVVAALAPLCVDRFQRANDSPNNLIELKKVSTWQQGSFVEKGGWATFPGSPSPDSAVASACGALLNNLK
jgi:hypothetical protein